MPCASQPVWNTTLSTNAPATLRHDWKMPTTPGETSERSAVLDQLFVDEAREQLELLRDAPAALPPDAYVLTTESPQVGATGRDA